MVAAAAGTAGFELIAHGVLPGKSELDQLDGACAVPAADLAGYAPPGPQHSGTFYSAARRREVFGSRAAAVASPRANRRPAPVLRDSMVLVRRDHRDRGRGAGLEGARRAGYR